MQKLIAAVVAAAWTLHIAAPAMARDFFNRNTMLGWRQQTGASVVAYLRAPLGPSSLKAPVRTGFALTGPRSYNAGEAPLYSQAPRLVDFALTKSGVDARWSAQFTVGNGVAWTNAPNSLQPGQVNLMESGMSWVAVGAIAAGIAAGAIAFIESERPEPTAP